MSVHDETMRGLIGEAQPELCIVGSPRHCDSNLKPILEFFRNHDIAEPWNVVLTSQTTFPMQSSRWRRQTSKTYEEFSWKINF